MEAVLENHSNFSNTTTNQGLRNPGFAVFLIVIAIPLVAVIFFNGLIAVVLLRSTSVAVTIRVPLINLLVVILFGAVNLLLGSLTTVVLVLSDSTEPPLPLCRFVLWVYQGTRLTRLLGLLVFSLMVFQTVTCGTRKFRAKWLILSLAVTWVIALLMCVHVLAPPIYRVQYVDGVLCFPTVGHPKFEIVQLSVYMSWIAFALLGFVSILVSICVVLGALCYFKRHTISEGAQYKKAIVKLAAFLVTGNILSVTVEFGLFTVNVWLIFESTVGVYLSLILHSLPFTSTPILIAVFLKPVQRGLHRLFCCKHFKGNGTIPMQQEGWPYRINKEKSIILQNLENLYDAKTLYIHSYRDRIIITSCIEFILFHCNHGNSFTIVAYIHLNLLYAYLLHFHCTMSLIYIIGLFVCLFARGKRQNYRTDWRQTLRNYEAGSGEFHPWVSSVLLLSRRYSDISGFSFAPTAILTYLPSTSGSCLDA